MTKVHSRAELAPALDLASEFAMKILVERAVRRAKSKYRYWEHEPKASVPGETRASSRIL